MINSTFSNNYCYLYSDRYDSIGYDYRYLCNGGIMFCDAPALMAVNCTFLDNELLCNTAYVPPQLFSSVIYAKTYTVIEKDTNKYFVFKMLKTSDLSDQDDNSYMQARLNFRNIIKEIEMLSRFNSPLIVKFHGACLCYKYKNSETFVNVLEYCQNGSLNNYIGKDNIIFNDTRKLNCIYGIASGRRYLHSHQFIHRNLNPRKILLDDRFIPKINDLSLAAIIDEKIVTMTNRVGIFAYMAPEMFKEDGIYSYPVDVYSFGILVHEILTGKLPFDGGFLEFLDFLKSGEKIKFSSNVPKCYQDLISKMLVI